jgi:metallo-beta-lactamase class B
MKAMLIAAGFAALSVTGALAAGADDNAPVAPFKIADNLYYVGASDVTSYLIATPAGLIVIDGGYDRTAPQILANIRTLGFDPRQVKILLNSHAHLDHAGGLAQLKKETGARLLASRADAPLLQDGGRSDPGNLPPFPAVKVDGFVVDNQAVELGGVKLTPRLTPGHTRGCTSWSMPLRVDGRVRQGLFICSVSILGNYRLTGPKPTYEGIDRDFSASFAKLKALPCEVFLGAHGGYFDLAGKRAKLKAGSPNPFVDPAGCRAFIAAGEKAYLARLAAERAGR